MPIHLNGQHVLAIGIAEFGERRGGFARAGLGLRGPAAALPADTDAPVALRENANCSYVLRGSVTS